jgi:rhomboid protease GluP
MGSPPPPGFTAQAPEILPPEREAAQQQEELRAVRERLPQSRSGPRSGPRSWAYAPATYLLVGINCAVFLAMVFSHVSFMEPTSRQLYNWGATHPLAVLYLGEWWRVVTAMFVHVGIIHLATNMWCLWNLGLLGEPLLGPVGVFAAYILSGAAGNLLSVGVNMAFHQERSVGAGASGAVFGLAGVLIVLLKSPRLPIPPKELSGLRRYVIYFAVLNFVIGFGGNQLNLGVNIDNMAHLGGFLGGIIFALPLVPLLGSPRPLFLLRRRVAVGLLTCVLVFFGFFLSTVFPAPSLPVQ